MKTNKRVRVIKAFGGYKVGAELEPMSAMQRDLLVLQKLVEPIPAPKPELKGGLEPNVNQRLEFGRTRKPRGERSVERTRDDDGSGSVPAA